MTFEQGRIPPGPAEKYDTSEDLLRWMTDQFDRFGSIYRASVYGTDVYVVSAPEHVDNVLRINWQNYEKGQAIKRIGFLLGNGLMVSEGKFWKSQRRMIQPAFHDKAISALVDVISAANIALLKKWKDAAKARESVNNTSDIGHMVLKVTLTSIFGDDYEHVAPHFNILSDESARNIGVRTQIQAFGEDSLRSRRPKTETE
jgi:cytochrome P450